MSNLISKQSVIESREVTKIIGKRHSDLLRDIKTYTEQMEEANKTLNAKLRSADYFIESTYKDSTGKENPCYLLTKLGCEFVSNKLTGVKGTAFTAIYTKRFNEMEKVIIKPKEIDGMKVVSLLHEEIGALISETTSMKSRVTKLEEEDFIKPFQKKALIGARTKKVFAITGGKNSQAYKNKSFRSKVYQDIFRNIKNIYNVNEYDAIPKQKFNEAMNLVNEYQLPLQLKYELEGINNQVRINEEVI
jgi:Rha family phage regulatory protein